MANAIEEAISGVFLFLIWAVDSSLLDPVIQNVRHIKATHAPEKVAGIWKKKMLWKPRWIKEWKQSNVLKPIWKKYWGPVIIREWVPIPKPPLNWYPDQSSASPSPELQVMNDYEPPKPNFAYLTYSRGNVAYKQIQETQNGNLQQNSLGESSAKFNFQPQPIPTNFGIFETDTPTRHGYSGDGSDYDLNPPVEPYDPSHGGYEQYHPLIDISTYPQNSQTYGKNGENVKNLMGQKPPTRNVSHGYLTGYQPSFPSTNLYHSSHTHSPDLTKFPPIWNSWATRSERPNGNMKNLLQQASSVFSVISNQHKASSSSTHSGAISHSHQKHRPKNIGYVQPASLIGEYHYTVPVNSYPNSHAFSLKFNTSNANYMLKNSNSSLNSLHHQNVPKFKALPIDFIDKKIHPLQLSPNVFNSNVPKNSSVKSKKPASQPNIKVQLGDSISTFHFIEAIPTNETQSKAILIGNFNQTYTGKNRTVNQVSIVTARPSKPLSTSLVAKMTKAVVQEYVKNSKKVNSTESSLKNKNTTTNKATVNYTNIFYTSQMAPATNSSISRKLKSDLTGGNISKNTTTIFIVTPTPQKVIGDI